MFGQDALIGVVDLLVVVTSRVCVLSRHLVSEFTPIRCYNAAAFDRVDALLTAEYRVRRL